MRDVLFLAWRYLAHNRVKTVVLVGSIMLIDSPLPFMKVSLGVIIPAVAFTALFFLFVVGIATLPRGRPSVLLLAFLLFYVAIHVAAHGYPRYRLPSLPVLFLVAGQGWVFLRTRPWPPITKARLASAAAVALVLVLSVGPSLVTWATEPWPPSWFRGEEAQDTTTPEEPRGGETQ